jgi:hypothetical protein
MFLLFSYLNFRFYTFLLNSYFYLYKSSFYFQQLIFYLYKSSFYFQQLIFYLYKSSFYFQQLIFYLYKSSFYFQQLIFYLYKPSLCFYNSKFCINLTHIFFLLMFFPILNHFYLQQTQIFDPSIGDG